MNENNPTSFSFEDGEIIDHNFRNANPEERSGIHKIESILRPVIEKDKLCGRIELAISNGQAHISYVNIEPFEAVPVLMEMISVAD